MASTSSTTPLPDGYRPPAAFVDADHHGAWIHICTAFGLVVGLISLCIRAYIRTKVSPPIRHDDSMTAVATFLSAIQAALTFAGVHFGYGTSLRLITEHDLEHLLTLRYSSDLFYILTIYTSKAAVVLLFMRISADRMHQAVGWGMLSAFVVLGVVSFLLTALRCSLSDPWHIYDSWKCSRAGTQATVVASFDVLTELMLFSTSILLVWDLQTAFRNKIPVVFAFGMRLPVIAVIILRLTYLRKELISQNPTLDGAIPALLRQVEIYYGLLAATVPCLRPFISGFSTNFGAMDCETVMGGSNIGTARSKGSSVGLSSMASRRRASKQSTIREKPTSPTSPRNMNFDFGDSLRPDVTGNQTRATRGVIPCYNRGSVGSDETKLIIQKQVQFSVGSEHMDSHLSRIEGPSSSR